MKAIEYESMIDYLTEMSESYVKKGEEAVDELEVNNNATALKNLNRAIGASTAIFEIISVLRSK